MQNFKVVLDPGNNWRIEKYSYTRKIGNDVQEYASGDISYSALPSTLIVPIEMKHSYHNSNNIGMKIEMSGKFKLREEVPSPEAEFMLSAFGFPEPVWSTDHAKSKSPLKNLSCRTDMI